jgi:hypothetical protein
MPDTKIFEEYIAGCIRDHVKGNVKPKRTKDQCLRIAFEKLRAGKLRKRKGDSAGDSAYVIAFYDVSEDRVEIIDIPAEADVHRGGVSLEELMKAIPQGSRKGLFDARARARKQIGREPTIDEIREVFNEMNREFMEEQKRRR